MKIPILILLASLLLVACGPPRSLEEKRAALFERVQNGNASAWIGASLGICGQIKSVVDVGQQLGWMAQQGQILGSADVLDYKEVHYFTLRFKIVRVEEHLRGVDIETRTSGVPWEPHMRLPVKYISPDLPIEGIVTVPAVVYAEKKSSLPILSLHPGDTFCGRLFAGQSQGFADTKYEISQRDYVSWVDLEVYGTDAGGVD